MRSALWLSGRRARAVGRNWVQRSEGTVEELPGCAETVMHPGDVFVIEAPGGGYGPPSFSVHALRSTE